LPFTLSYDSCGATLPGDAPCYVNGSASGLKTGVTGFAGGSGAAQSRYFTPPGIGNDGFTAAPLDTIGNGGRNNAWGPKFFNGDLSLLKNVTIREKYTAQFRMDAFNAFNHVNLGNPGGSVDSGGTIGGGTYPNGSVNPRQLQFTARIQF
jgi:hypothetical protein